MILSGWNLFRWNHDHCRQIDQNSRGAAWNESDEHGKAEPERADAEEFAKSAAHASDDAVIF